MEKDIKADGKKVAINDYPEKTIRQKIISKVNPVKRKRGSHKKGKIYVGKTLASVIKIPNDHARIMKESKTKYICKDLLLEPAEFNDLIDCPLTGPKYYKIIKDRI